MLYRGFPSVRPAVALCLSLSAGPLLAALGDVPVARNAILLTTDGPRWQEVFAGQAARAAWTDHDDKVAGSENIWIAAMGPAVAPLWTADAVAITQTRYGPIMEASGCPPTNC